MTQALRSGRIDVGDTDAEGVINAVTPRDRLLAVAAPTQHLSYVVAVQPEIKIAKGSRWASRSRSRGRARCRNICCSRARPRRDARNTVTWIPIGGASERRLALVNNRVKGALLHLDYALAAKRDSNVVALDRVARATPTIRTSCWWCARS